jgi:hypothetical protein
MNYLIFLIVLNLKMNSIIVEKTNNWVLKWSDHFIDNKLNYELWKLSNYQYGMNEFAY